jgi:ABC-2 type transport system ATP-binding protein
LLGPNGAGKTTTISVLSCLLKPTGGDAIIGGHSVSSASMEVRRIIGVVPQDIALYNMLSARENLVFWGRMYDMDGAQLKQRVDEVLEQIGLTDKANAKIETYSGGMKRRVNIGVGLLHKPRIIYMDEPTVGIDPQSRRNILDSVVSLKDQGMTVLYTTHYMEEAQELSDHIAIMDHGKLMAYGTQEELVKLVGQQTRIDLNLNVDAGRILDSWRTLEGVTRVSAEDGKVSVLVNDSNLVLPRLFESAAKLSARITSVDIQEPNLEAVFLHLTGRALRD